jgi:hypothetical protein
MEQRAERLDATIESILDRVVPTMLRIDWRTHHLAQNVGVRDSDRVTDVGLVIERVEPWGPGEKVDDIASAATGWQELLTTIYRDETPLDVIVLADLSAAMNFGTERTTKRILAAEIQAGILAAAEQRRDNMAAFAYSDAGIESRLPLQTASRELLHEALWLYLSAPTATQAQAPSAIPPRASNESGLVEALQSLPVNRKCLVFVLSDFGNLAEAETEALTYAACRHDVCCVVLEDRREEELPPGSGVRLFRDLRSGATQTVSLTVSGRRRWRKEFLRGKQALVSLLSESCGCTVWTFRTGAEPAESLAMLLAGEDR